MSTNEEGNKIIGSGNILLEKIGELALGLHLNYSKELNFDLPSEMQWDSSPINSPDFLIEENVIRFQSLEARNRFIASYVFGRNMGKFAANPQMWLATAYDLWRCEIGSQDTASGRLLSFVHKEENIFIIAITAIEQESTDVFDVLHLVEAALPYLTELSADLILKLCSAQHEHTKNDLAGGIFFNKLEKALVNHPDICLTILENIKTCPLKTTINLHSVVLISLSKSDPNRAVNLALIDAQSLNIILKSKALWTLGLLLLTKVVLDEEISTVSTIIINNMSDQNEEVRKTSFCAAANAVMVVDEFIEPLSKMGKAEDQDALASMANILMLNVKEMKTKTYFDEWVQLLCKLKPRSNFAIDNFDQILRQLISDEGYQQLAISCLTEWARINLKDFPRESSISKLFDGTIHELVNRPNLLSQLITEWFLSDFKQLAFAAAGVLSHLLVVGFENPEFSSNQLDSLDQKDLVFLARRMLGYVSSEEHLLSLTMSFLKTENPKERTFGIVHSLLIDEIGQDYPEPTIDILKQAKINLTETDWIYFYSSIIDELDNRQKSLEALPNILELRPSPSLQRKFALTREKQMANATEEAQEKSIIRQLATEIPIKAGHAWFSFREGSYTESSYMQSFSHSVTLPRRHVLDSVGYDLSRLFMRLAKREDA